MSIISVNHVMVNTVIFDFDGTLAKLNIDFEQMRKSVAELVFHYGVNNENLRHCFVLEMIDEATSILLNETPDQSLSFKLEACKILETIELEAAQKGELFGDTKAMLAALKHHDIHVGIITRNCTKAVYEVFPDIDNYCFAVVCRNDVTHVKPNPEHLNYALKKLQSRPEQSIMIGDHLLDIETGRNAGTLTAGVLTGHFKETDFLKAGADIVYKKASDILMDLF